MRRFTWLVTVLLIVSVPAVAANKRQCRPVRFLGYKYQTSTSTQDRYFNKQTGLTLFVRCPVATVLADELINKYKLESSVRNTVGDAVYFEFNVRGRYKRVYVITRSPTLEFTFSARRKQRANLDDTQSLIESAYPKLK